MLVRTLIEEALTENHSLLLSQDYTETIGQSSLSARISNHLQVPIGPISDAWQRTAIEWLRQHQVDLCHFHLAGTFGWESWRFNGGPISRIARNGITTVATNHSGTSLFSGPFANRPFLRNLASACRKWPGKAQQLASVSWEASVSCHDQSLGRRCFPMFRDKLLQVYHSRLDCNQPVPKVSSTKTILNVGTIAYHKGQHHLTEAFARIAEDFPDWNLTLAGFHAERDCVDQIRSTIRNAGIEDRVDILGPIADPSHRFQECAIYVQPSLLEGLGLSLQEAMFYAKACIGSACGGIPELIHNSSVGITYPPGCVEDLASAMTRLMVAPELRNELGNAARQSILDRGMTRQSMMARYQQLYHQVIC